MIRKFLPQNGPPSEASLGEDRFAFLDGRLVRLSLLFLGAVFTALTLIFTDLWVFEWIALLPAALAVLRIGEDGSVRLRTCYGYGLFFFWVFYAVVFHWFVSMYPLEFTELTKPAAAAVVAAGVFGLSLLQALISAWAFVLYAFLCRSRFVSRRPFFRPFLFAGAWTVFEWVQNFGWWGVPWGRLALGQVDAQIGAQTARWFGSYFVSFLLLAVNLCIAYAVLHRSFRKVASLTAAAMLAGNLLFGAVLLAVPRDGGKKVTVAAVQGNIANKWDFSTLGTILRVYREHTLLAAEDGAEIVIWPESTLPVDFAGTPSMRKFASDLAKEADVFLLIGAFRTDTEGEVPRDYNSLFAILPDGTILDTVYDKQQLVPFGEFVPMREFVTMVFPPLADVGMLSEDVTKGEAGKNIPTEYGTLGGMICFDSIYERVSLSAVRNGAEVLCLSSNDAWFLDSAAIYMHHDQARLRAIETGRYLVRAGNSGITSIVSPTGKVLTSIEPLTEGYVVGEVTMRSDRTLYSVIGNTFVYLILAGLAALFCLEVGARIRDRRSRVPYGAVPPSTDERSDPE